MCGIAGEVNLINVTNISHVSSMAEAMRHRGPDDSGTFLSPSFLCALAHQRLSIIDLTPMGRQPMSTADGRQTIVFNGEIYNFKALREDLITQGVSFESQSDTEVLLKLWEREDIHCLGKLRGMFAFAVWDERDNSITLVRDPFGIKPIYYRHDKNRFFFASEIKSFRSVGLASVLDPIGLALFLRWGSVPPPFTIYSEIKCLPPGSWLRFSDCGLEVNNYWNHTEALLKARSEAKIIYSDRKDAVSFVRQTLLESVKAHLVSDTPVGAFLSGGIDSSAVVSLMRQAGQERIATFSITFDDPKLDESCYSQLAAKTYQTEHHEWNITVDKFPNLKRDFMSALDQPTIDGFNTFLISRFAHEHGCKVVTSGVGGDEFFSGYKGTFQDLPKLINRLSQITSPVLKGCGGIINLLARSGFFSSSWSRFGHFLLGEINLVRGYDMWRGLFAPHEIKQLFSDKSLGEEVAEIETLRFFPKIIDDLSPREKIMVLEASRYLGCQLLCDSDIFSMANSLELRVPLVDKIVAESLAIVSDELFLNFKGIPKPLLVASVADLPSELVCRKKMGFAVPFNAWLRIDEWHPKSDLLNREVFRRVDNLFQKSKLHWSRRWALEVLDTYANQ